VVGLFDRQRGHGPHVARSEPRVALLVKRRGAHSRGDRRVQRTSRSIEPAVVAVRRLACDSESRTMGGGSDDGIAT
jgi:hypothetical protein